MGELCCRYEWSSSRPSFQDGGLANHKSNQLTIAPWLCSLHHSTKSHTSATGLKFRVRDSTHSRTDHPNPPSRRTRATPLGTAAHGTPSSPFAAHPPPCASTRTGTRRLSRRRKATAGLSFHQLSFQTNLKTYLK